MLTKIKNLYQTLKENVFLKYPVTICAIWIASLLTAFVVDMPRDFLYEVRFIQAMGFMWIFAAGNLFVEEYFGKKDKWIRIIGFVLSAMIAVTFIYFGTQDADYILGIDSDIFLANLLKILACYLSWIAALCIYKMYKDNQTTFEKYCISVFGSVMRTSIVYGLFALGLAAIIVIFNILLFDTDEFLYRIEVLLACGLYVPGMILAFSKVQEEIGKFLRLVVKFVLLILTIAAFVIIYLYIFKLILSWDLPSNEVFPILSWLFVCGLPIWTMAMYFEEDKMGKIAAKLPYAFIPFVLLQCVCIGLRIHEYGLTDSRYICCFLIVAEVIYLILFAVKKRVFLPTIFFVAAALVSIFLLAPVLKYDSMVYFSQKGRFEKITNKADAGIELSAQEIKCALGAYDELRFMSKGKKYIEGLSTSQKNFVDTYKDMKYYDGDLTEKIYISGRWNIDKYPLNVKGHEQVYKIRLQADLHEYDEPADLTLIQYNLENDLRTIDMTDFANKVKEFNETNPEYSEISKWLYENGRIRLANGDEIHIDSFDIDFRDDVCVNFHMEGYYLK